MHANMKLVGKIEMLKNIQKNINSHQMSETNRVTHNTMKRLLCEKSIVIMHEREISSKRLVDMLENIDIIDLRAITR